MALEAEGRTLREALFIVPLDEWQEHANDDLLDLIDADVMCRFLDAARSALAPKEEG